MTLRSLLILPALCAPAWFAGRYSASESAAGVVTATSPAALPDSQHAATLAQSGDGWDTLSKQPATPENRWRALTLFEQWVKTNPAAAAARLAALPEDGCRLWPKRGALEAFCKVWAAHDPDGAWQAVHNDPLVSQRDTVAAFRARTHARETATDLSLSEEVRTMARCQLAADNPAAAEELGLLFGDALASAMLNTCGKTPFARWRELKVLGKQDYEYGAAFERMALTSRNTALAIWQEGIKLNDEEGSGRSFQNIAFSALASTAANAEELKALVPVINQQEAWRPVMTTLDDTTLRSLLQYGPGSAEIDAHLFASAAGEMLARDPAALLPYLQKWDRNDAAAKTLTSYIRPDGTPEQAARVRALIEAAPPSWQRQIAAATHEILQEFDPAFLLSQVERYHRNPDGKEASGHDDEPAVNGLFLSPRGVFNRWLQSDTAAAVAWMNDHPSLIDPGSLENAAKEWVANDPEAASAWMATLPGGTPRDAAILGLVQSMQTYDPAAASAWAARVTDAGTRKELQDQIMRHWRQWNPNAQPVEP